MHTGIFHKGYNRKLGYLEVFTFSVYFNVIIQPFSKTILLKRQISFHKFNLLEDTHGIIAPFHILSLHHRQFGHHVGCLVFFFQNAVHPDAFQYIK